MNNLIDCYDWLWDANEACALLMIYLQRRLWRTHTPPAARGSRVGGSGAASRGVRRSRVSSGAAGALRSKAPSSATLRCRIVDVAMWINSAADLGGLYLRCLGLFCCL